MAKQTKNEGKCKFDLKHKNSLDSPCGSNPEAIETTIGHGKDNPQN